MNGKNVDSALAAIERAADYKRRGATCVPVYADVFIDGSKIGHVASDGWDQRMWTFFPLDKKRRKALGSITSLLPKWANRATIGDFKTCEELMLESEVAAHPKIKNQDITKDRIYDAIADDSFPGNPIPFANGLADHVREHGTDSIRSDDAKRLLWILMGQAYGQVAKIDLVDEWNRLTKRGGTKS
jgi:hypothetical protein